MQNDKQTIYIVADDLVPTFDKVRGVGAVAAFKGNGSSNF
jgi:hypothetical protein